MTSSKRHSQSKYVSFIGIIDMTRSSALSTERNWTSNPPRIPERICWSVCRQTPRPSAPSGSSHHRSGGNQGRQDSIAESNKYTARVGTKRYVEDTDDAPIVVTLEVGKCTVKQTLVNTGSVVNILFHDAVAQMGVPNSEIRPYILPLIGFTG